MRYTVTSTGTRHVRQRATSNEEKRITVVLACTSRGEKLPPLVVLKHLPLVVLKHLPLVVLKHPLPRGVQPPDGIRVYHNINAWMTGPLTEEWLNIYKDHLKDKYLLMDSFSGHKTNSLLAILNNTNNATNLNLKGYSIIPPGTTSKFQPLDVGVNKPFKDILRRKWNNWMETGNTTARGNYKSASVSLLLQWIVEAWDEISTLTIINSYTKALSMIDHE